MLEKAAIGSGFPAGLAVDLAAAGVWLCSRRLDGVGAVLDGIANGFEAELDLESGTAALHLTNVGRYGSSPFELLVAGDVDLVIVEGSDASLLLFGLAGIVAGSTETAFAISIGAGPPTIVSSRTMTLEIDLSLDGSDRVQITVVDPSDAGSSRQSDPQRDGIEVDQRQWATATSLAARTYVAASEESRRRGAGPT